MLNRANPLIVQSDWTVLLEVDNPLFEEARDALARFAELEKSPEHFHTYRISPLSLWNAASSGVTGDDVLDTLGRYGRYDVPANIAHDVLDYIKRYGRLKLVRDDGQLVVTAEDPYLFHEVSRLKSVSPLLGTPRDDRSAAVPEINRGLLKSALVSAGFPVEDLAGYVEGERLPLALAEVTRGGRAFDMRNYQRQAVSRFYSEGGIHGGSGVIVMPCGAGKTVVGIGVMAALQTATLILSTNTTAVRQWIQELVDKTDLDPDQVGEYTGDTKQIRPVTVTTYQMLTYRSAADEDFPHMTLFNRRDWGLIIYDEVHLLPAPVFRVTAGLQARRRLGLTATLIREDGREGEVFSLIGPKRYDAPWKVLERQGWIATAVCCEIRIPFDDQNRIAYAAADRRHQFRVAAENPRKIEVLQRLLQYHQGDRILIIGQYITQLTAIAEQVGAPLITGSVPQDEREILYGGFRRGSIPVLVVSKVANFAVDLPDANVAIQVSGTFGSRQEEAQRLGRVLRPKSSRGGEAHFYTLVTRQTVEGEFAMKRQLFLVEQGYEYHIVDEEDFDPGGVDKGVDAGVCTHRTP